MNEDDLDELLRAAQRARAAAVTSQGDPVTRVRARVELKKRRRRTRVALGAALATIMLGAAGIVLVAWSNDSPTDSPDVVADDPSTSTDAPSPSPSDSAEPATRDEALSEQLAANEDALQSLLYKSTTTGVFLCGVNVLGSGKQDTELYLWVLCEEFSTGPKAEVLSGASSAAVLTVTGQDADITITDVWFPRQESIASDIRSMVPDDLEDQLISGNGSLEVHPSEEEMLKTAQAMS